MKTFFSIMYLTLNASLDEKISIGIFMFNNEDVKFKFSDTKLGVIKNLIPNQNHHFIKSYFKSLNNHLYKDPEDKILFGINKKISLDWVNEQYLNYLHRYSNNIISFSKPKKVDISFNKSNFDKLYEKYVFSKDVKIDNKDSKEDIIKIVKKKLYSRIKSNVNLDATISPSDFKELISPVNVNFIGKNGQIVSGQTIDFSKRYVDLERDLTKYISFTKAVDFEKGSGHYFLVGDEPKKANSKNHTIWKHIYDSKIVEYVHLNETDKIKDYLDSKQVLPYFEDLVD
ncbi:MAG: hypothetical protein AAF611_15795 [Bacteroidota bacterium]